VCRLAIGLSILELLRHDKLPVSSREQRSKEQTPSDQGVHVSLKEQNKGTKTRVVTGNPGVFQGHPYLYPPKTEPVPTKTHTEGSLFHLKVFCKKYIRQDYDMQMLFNNTSTKHFAINEHQTLASIHNKRQQLDLDTLLDHRTSHLNEVIVLHKQIATACPRVFYASASGGCILRFIRENSSAQATSSTAKCLT